jgi:uncharacterized protein
MLIWRMLGYRERVGCPRLPLRVEAQPYRRKYETMTSPNAPTHPAPIRRNVLAAHPLVCFFLIAFAFSWLIFLLGPLTYFGVLDLSPQLVGLVAILGLLGPSVAGFIVTGATEGDAGVRRLLRRCVLWWVGIRWYLFALVVVPLVMVLGTLVRPGALTSFDASALPFSLAYLGAFVLMLATGGPLFEEPGWRGTALPRLQQLHGPLVGGLILGALWALWHLPGFLIPSQSLSDIPPRGTVMDFVRFAIALIALAYIIQWVFNSTGGSVLMAMLTHASWNTFYSASLIGIFPAPAVMGSYLNLLIGGGALALVLIALTRGQLGYRGETDAPSALRVR